MSIPIRHLWNQLCEGFWPWADTHIGTYLDTHDKSLGTPADPAEAAFLRTQRDHEVKMGQFSQPFGHVLLPGMYSSPVHGVLNHTPQSYDL